MFTLHMLRELFLLLLWLTAASTAQGQQETAAAIPVDVLEKIPYASHTRCESEIMDDGYSIDLTPEVSFHFKHPNHGHFLGTVHYQGEGWLAIGFSKDGNMINSKAIIGLPASDGSNSAVPMFYDLDSKDDDGQGITPDHQMGHKTSLTGFVHQNGDGTTIMHFSVHGLFEQIEGMHHHSVVNMLFAVGYTNELGLHRHRGAFRLDTRNCPAPPDPLLLSSDDLSATSVTLTTYDHKAAFAAHGFFATLAFAVVIPAALASAWFRSLMPKWWIYVHVLSNCAAVFFTTVSVATAFGGMVMRENSSGGYEYNTSHMSIGHHWVGLVLFLMVLFQVVNGFRRPPVEAKEDPTVTDIYAEPAPPKKMYCFCVPAPTTTRDKWKAVHVVTALTVIALTLYQLSSGLSLYTTEYGGNKRAALALFWTWVVLLTASMLALKYFANQRSARRRSSPTKNLMPQRSELEDDGNGDEGDDDASQRTDGDSERTGEFSNII